MWPECHWAWAGYMATNLKTLSRLVGELLDSRLCISTSYASFQSMFMANRTACSHTARWWSNAACDNCPVVFQSSSQVSQERKPFTSVHGRQHPARVVSTNTHGLLRPQTEVIVIAEQGWGKGTAFPAGPSYVI